MSVRRSVLARRQLARLRLDWPVYRLAHATVPRHVGPPADVRCNECGVVARQVPQNDLERVAGEHVLDKHHPGVTFDYPDDQGDG